MATHSKTRSLSDPRRSPSSRKATRKLLAPKVKSTVGQVRLRKAVQAVQRAAEAA